MNRDLSLLRSGLLVAWIAAAVLPAQGLPPFEWREIQVQSPVGLNGPVRAFEILDLGSGPQLVAGAGGVMHEHGLKLVGVDAAPGVGFQGICPAFPPCLGPTIFALEAFDDGSGPALFAAVEWLSGGGGFGQGVWRWSGFQGPFALLGGSLAGMRALEVFDDGSGDALHAGGSFAAAGASFVGRWNGTAWVALGAGVNGRVDCLFEWDDGTGTALYAGGAFTVAGGQMAPGIARWDGVGWSPLGLGVGGAIPEVHALAAFDDGSGPALYAGGSFTAAGGLPANGLARWDGVSWSPVTTGFTGGVPTTRINALHVHDDGSGDRLFVGGRFAVAGAVATTGIAAWDGSAFAAVAGGLGTSAESVMTLASYAFPGAAAPFPPRAELFAGGDFAINPATLSTGLARLANLGAFLLQRFPGDFVFVLDRGLVVGREYYNLFSADPGPAGPGGGPFGGLWATTPMAVQFLVDQLTLPAGSPPFRFTASQFLNGFAAALPAGITLDVLCIEVTGGMIGRVQDGVSRIVVQ